MITMPAAVPDEMQYLAGEETLRNPLDHVEPFVSWLEAYQADAIVGRSGDYTRDPIAFYLRERYGAPAPFIDSNYWLSNHYNPMAGLVFPTPQWVSDLIYLIDVWPANTTVTAGQVLSLLHALRARG